MKRPSFQFYPGDWQRSPHVRMLSLEARGLWIEILCLMHDGEPYGHLTMGGIPLDDQALGKVLGLAPVRVRKLMAELEMVGAFSRTEGGVIYSRRMVKDEELRAERAEHGKTGGAAAFRNPNASRPGEARGGGRPRKNQPPPPPDGAKERPAATSATPASSLASSSTENGARAAAPALEFCRWFVTTALQRGALPPHFGLDPEAEARKQFAGYADQANALLATYDRAEIEARAIRFFDLKIANGFRRPVNIATFSEAWDWAAVSRAALPRDEKASRDPAGRAAQLDFVERYAAAEGA